MNCANHKRRYMKTRAVWIAVGCVGVGVVWLLVNYYVSINLYLHLESRDDPEIVHVNATSASSHAHYNNTPHHDADADDDDDDDEYYKQKRARTRTARHPNNPLLMDQNVETLIKNTNSSDYKWLGNHWIAPPGVPTFTPRQIRAYFKKRNVLVIGDSTSRRFYATLFGMFNADDLDNVSVEEISNKTLLDENMSFKYVTNCTLQQNRSIAKHMTAQMGSTCKNWGG